MKPAALLLTALALAALPAAAQTPCADGMADGHACSNTTLLSNIPLSVMEAEAANDIWGWTDSVTGKEYALVGLANGTAFVDVTDPLRPVYLGKLPTHTTATVWRDVKVYGDYAFIVSEADGHGMQVFDLARLRDVAPTQGPVTFTEDAHYGLIGQSHNIAINEETATAYIVGNREERGCAGGLHMVDISDPLAPAYAGCFGEDGYTHDVQCVLYQGPDAEHQGREVCFASNEDTVTIVDVTDRQNPVQLSQAVYPDPAYTHQGWLTEDHRFFLANDELDEMRYGNETRMLIFDVTDLDEPEFVAPAFSGLPAIDHNLYVRGTTVYASNYRSGLRVFDVSNVAEGEAPAIAHFDSFPDDDAAQFGGTWSNYPYFESGTVLVNDMSGGLFVVRVEQAEPLALGSAQVFASGRAADLIFTVPGGAARDLYVERQTDDGYVTVGHLRVAEGRDTYRLHVGTLPEGAEPTFRVRAVDASGMTLYSAPFGPADASAGASAGTAAGE